MRSRTALSVLSVATFGLLAASPVGSAAADEAVAEPSSFTSAYTAMATPGMVVNADGVPTPGTAGATGRFDYRINSDDEIICYDITVTGISEPFQSPARTATHIHQAAAGQAGPPRIAFPDPTPQSDGSFRSAGCLEGPFTTGITGSDGADTGTNFTLAQIEADPSAFFTDTHTAANPAGAVRGQLTVVPLGGVATGGGGTADRATSPLIPVGAAVLALGGFAWVARRAATR
ncbi:CHRD domain-containing protein [Nakamurella deserti]|uniref:CHRD domain-containing protein n=1 Tax=Nakamurella deserti TaxID=2164074 RepID=UPI000DBE4EDC|nr:CHRD domain-containing protein [Nakamurella deserti]